MLEFTSPNLLNISEISSEVSINLPVSFLEVSLILLTKSDLIIYNAYMNTREEILNKLKEIKPMLHDEFYIKNLGLFGSYAREENSESSDIDLLFEYKENSPFSLFTLIDLEDFLTNLLNIKVDLANKKTLKPDLKDNILNEVILV